MLEPILSRITIYPVKSLDGVSLKKAVITEGGCLLHDREFVICDEAGIIINGKKNPLVHALRTSFDLENEMITFHLSKETNENSFHLQKDKLALEAFLSAYFKKNVFLKQDKTGRFLDIPDISGATIISTASLKEVSSWFNHMPIDETRKRFRATLELEAVPAFWEDQLFLSSGKAVEFKIGDVILNGMSPRERCVVPTRHPENAAIIHGFPKIFSEQRAATLPPWSTLDDFEHYYYFSVDCAFPASEIGKTIEVGSKVQIINRPEFAS